MMSCVLLVYIPSTYLRYYDGTQTRYYYYYYYYNTAKTINKYVSEIVRKNKGNLPVNNRPNHRPGNHQTVSCLATVILLLLSLLGANTAPFIWLHCGRSVAESIRPVSTNSGGGGFPDFPSFGSQLCIVITTVAYIPYTGPQSAGVCARALLLYCDCLCAFCVRSCACETGSAFFLRARPKPTATSEFVCARVPSSFSIRRYCRSWPSGVCSSVCVCVIVCVCVGVCVRACFVKSIARSDLDVRSVVPHTTVLPIRLFFYYFFFFSVDPVFWW